ncbi:MAG: hypothetical protein K9M96_03145 [Deltaproteobacteria bacterium]|nr:hypothetical protein [Deltaproteobacteria bacterium]
MNDDRKKARCNSCGNDVPGWFFPMPDYDLSDPDRVRVRLFGKILDENYTRLLIEKTDLSLLDVTALDKVQKHRRITEKEAKRLRRQKLIEGRRPNLFVSAKIADITGDRAPKDRHPLPQQNPPNHQQHHLGLRGNPVGR